MELPQPYDPLYQRWFPTTTNPYPMNFVQAPSATHQLLINYKNDTFLQGLHPVKGPFMYPYRPPQTACIAYPVTHSIPGPYLQSYIAIAGCP